MSYSCSDFTDDCDGMIEDYNGARADAVEWCKDHGEEPPAENEELDENTQRRILAESIGINLAQRRELLECLKALVGEADLGEIDHDDETRAMLDRARAAIARAEELTP